AVPRCRPSPAWLAAAADAPDSRLVWLLNRVPTGARRQWLVAARADLGARADAQSPATLGPARAALDDGRMILRMTLKPAELVGETAAEWQLLEKQVRAGRWTSGARADAGLAR